jgi:hypothetical protein
VSVNQAISVISQALSALSQDVSARLVSINNAISIVSQAHSVLSQDVSARLVSVNQSISVLSQSLSVLSQSLSALSQAVSVLSVAVGGVSNTLSVISNYASVVSNYASVVSQYASAISVQGNAVSVISQQVSVLSNRVSALSSLVSTLLSALDSLSMAHVSVQSIVSVGRVGLIGRVTGAQAIATSTFANVSGLSVVVSALGVYKVDGIVLHSFTSGVSAGLGHGFTLTFPAMAFASGKITDAPSMGQTAADRVGYFDGGGSGSIIVSGTVTATVSTLVYPAFIDALFNVSVSGVIQVQAKAGASAATQGMVIGIGSYIRAMRLN